MTCPSFCTNSTGQLIFEPGTFGNLTVNGLTVQVATRISLFSKSHDCGQVVAHPSTRPPWAGSDSGREGRLNEAAGAADASRDTIWHGNCDVVDQQLCSNITPIRNTIPIQYPMSNFPAKARASFKRLYRKRARAPSSATLSSWTRASDKALTFNRRNLEGSSEAKVADSFRVP